MPAIEVQPQTHFTDPIVVDLHGRVTALESRDQDKSTEIALIKNDLTYIKLSQDKVSAGINKILWAVILGFVTAGTTFFLNGGFNLNFIP